MLGKDGRYRRIEGSGQRRRRAVGNHAFRLAAPRPSLRPSTDARPATNLYRRTLAAKRDPCHGAEADVSVPQKLRDLRLGNAAPADIGK